MKFLVAAATTLCLAAMTMAPLASAQTEAPTCPMTCLNESPCVEGEDAYAGHPQKSNGSPLDFLEETSREGYYCDCPDNFTGIRCGRTYVECAGTGHYCYHGGTCLENLSGDPIPDDQLFCNCADASHGDISYVGKYCEQEGVQPCDEYGEFFCLNGSTCKEDFETKLRPCECLDGYRGPHCEFEDGSVPRCDLECEHDGECQLGIKDYDTALYTEFWKTDGGYMHCTCEQGYFGDRCEVEGEPCGTAHCFNGASCLETINIAGDTTYACDCRTAFNAEGSFAGDYCQAESTSFCTKTANANGHLFCTNGGACPDESHLDCECSNGFHGPSCEFRDSEAGINCTLTCENKGQCRGGSKDVAMINQFGLELKGFNQSHVETWEHCVCPPGYFGVQCEHELEICPGGDHVCLHGSKCIAQNETTDLSHTCDCDSGFDAIEKIAGKYCQFTSTAICTKNGQPGVGKANFAFCVNSGTCKALVENNQPPPGCTCPPGFDGDHCEFLQVMGGTVNLGATATENQSPDTANDPAVHTGLIIAIGVCFVAIFAFTVLVVVRQKKQGKEVDSVNTSTGETEPSGPVWSDSNVEETITDFPGIFPGLKEGKTMETVEII